MHLGMSITEVRRLPVRYRMWYIKRLSKHFEDKRNAATRGTSNNNQTASERESFDKFEKMINQKL